MAFNGIPADALISVPEVEGGEAEEKNS